MSNCRCLISLICHSSVSKAKVWQKLCGKSKTADGAELKIVSVVRCQFCFLGFLWTWIEFVPTVALLHWPNFVLGLPVCD